jgi:hypothetical protein
MVRVLWLHRRMPWQQQRLYSQRVERRRSSALALLLMEQNYH